MGKKLHILWFISWSWDSADYFAEATVNKYALWWYSKTNSSMTCMADSSHPFVGHS